MIGKRKVFSLKYYEYLLNSTKSIIRVRDYKSASCGLILRHDVDCSLEYAFRLSRIEKRNSVLSTYHILLNSDLYNPLSKASVEIITKMYNDGFEIGLHFDPIVYGNLSEEELIKKLRNEITIIESVYNFKIESYSLHNPSMHGIFLGYREIINAYDPEIFSEDSYISDSMFSFRGKNPLEYIKKSENQRIQFLIHPIHFFSGGNLSYEKQINNMVNNYYKKINEIFSVNRVYLKGKDFYNVKLSK